MSVRHSGVFIVSGMRTALPLAIVGLISVSSLTMTATNAPGDKFWPQWRGPLATGVAPSADPPIERSETRNISWKIEIPGRGSATPVVWGDRLFLLTAVPEGLPADKRHQPLGGVAPRVVHSY